MYSQHLKAFQFILFLTLKPECNFRPALSYLPLLCPWIELFPGNYNKLRDFELKPGYNQIDSD